MSSKTSLKPPPELPDPVFACLYQFLDFKTCLVIRLVSKTWLSMMDHEKTLKFPAVYGMPTELIHEIYHHLEPLDFNSARHTSHLWMEASRDHRILENMCARVGWWKSIKDHAPARILKYGSVISKQQEEEIVGMLHQTVSRESALSGKWKGNGVDEAVANPFEVVTTTDFSSLMTRSDQELKFTVSDCNKFVLIAVEETVFIYSLTATNHHVRFDSAIVSPVSKIQCKGRVLAMSMDTTYGRYAVAILLEDRVGFVSEIVTLGSLEGIGQEPDGKRARTRASFSGKDEPRSSSEELTDTVATTIHFGHDAPALPFPPTSAESKTESAADSLILANKYQGKVLSKNPYDHGHSSHTTNANLLMPWETGTRKHYGGICSSIQPPVSVAICGFSQSVAFGCTSETADLRWTEQQSGNEKRDAVPVINSGENLYFLPKGALTFSSHRRLRVVGSPSAPKSDGDGDDRLNMIDNASFGVNLFDRPVISSFSRELYGYAELPRLPHYHALPLSDGVNYIFTDPETNKVCLGTPGLRRSGFHRFVLSQTRRFNRNVILEGPGSMPTHYAVGRDLTWGARILVAYGREVWYYTVTAGALSRFVAEAKAKAKSDHYRHRRLQHGNDTEDPEEDADPSPSDLLELPTERGRSSGLHLLKGLFLGDVGKVAALAVDSKPATITLWAFSAEGNATAWQVRGANKTKVSHRIVNPDGSMEDLDGISHAGLSSQLKGDGQGKGE